MIDINKQISAIREKSVVAGISSDEVANVKSLVENKCKDKTLFVCEGLWAVDKLIEKNFEVLQFFYNADKLISGTLPEKDIEKIANMALYAKKTFAISEKSCKKISDREKNNFKCVVTDLQAKKSYREIDYSGRIAIVAGNEHTGISASWRKLKNSESIIIPMLGSCESLNVGFASTLVAYEAGLQKFGNKKIR